jgi:ABC-type nickel/cobalt efflux system permease component RcnA
VQEQDHQHATTKAKCACTHLHIIHPKARGSVNKARPMCIATLVSQTLQSQEASIIILTIRIARIELE